MKIRKVWGSESFQVGRHIHIPGRKTYPRSTGGEPPALGTVLGLTLHLFKSCCSSLSFIISFNILVSVEHVFLEFCEPLSKLIKPKEGVVGTPDLQPSQKEVVGILKLWVTCYLRLASKVGGSLV